MRFKFVGTILLLMATCVATAAPKLTIYADGKSCPADCDVHVVFHKSLNGTKFAHAPDSLAQSPVACKRNQSCEICFDEAASECLTTPYRGSGPGKNTFDLTPAFYKEWCAKPNIPTSLSNQCAQMQRTASRWSDRTSCILDPEHNLCAQMISVANQAKEADTPKYDECKRKGQREYNKSRSAADKRAHDCAYEFESSGGPNSNGLRWQMLLPGACRDGEFVGRDGLDCCSGDKFVDASLSWECKGFYPKQTP